MDSDQAPPTFTLKDEPIENHRRLRVRVIGAGYSGIYLGIRIAQRLRNVDLRIYERNAGVGGTWWVNRYPGCACDIPSHSYQYSFEPNPRWPSFYASQSEIHMYLDDVADKYGVKRFVMLEHKVEGCSWNSKTMKWCLRIRNLKNGGLIDDETDVLISASGNLSTPAWPDIPGLFTFRGQMMHSASWKEGFDFKNRSIGVIGNGSSAIQIVPVLQKIDKTRLSCFVRSGTWITNPFGDNTVRKLGLDPEKLEFSTRQKEEFANSPGKLYEFRKAIEQESNTIHAVSMRDHEMQRTIAESTRVAMRKRLASRPDIAEFLIPSFAIGCKRMTPGHGYLEALTQSNVDFITDRIVEVNSQGVLLQSGTQVNLDYLICATGFDTSGVPPFSIYGRNGVSLETRFKPYPEAYLSLAIDGFPNFFMVAGPNSSVGTGSFTMILETQGDYIVKCIRKLQKEDYTSMEVKKKRVSDWSEYCCSYFKTTVYTDYCKSWYKSQKGDGDRITGLWPGSTLHALEALRAPRWEDYHWESPSDDANKLRWLGNGWSITHTRCNDQGKYGGDPAWYLDLEFQHIPVPEKPEEDPRYKKRPFSH
ncbi:putative Flavin-binding monooxygenase [Seiridium unicorne]|uniref:Flavin-binding monooxygenase n=1 Tax=Seiridium unicorne TaxID=138068 RepID=A0ABR2VB23_9PEZI